MEIFETPYQLQLKKKHVQKVVNFEKTNIVNMQLAAGEEVPTHDADADVLIIVKSGKLQFTVEDEKMEVSPETMLHMVPKEKHSLKAIDDSDFLVIQIKR